MTKFNNNTDIDTNPNSLINSTIKYLKVLLDELNKNLDEKISFDVKEVTQNIEKFFDGIDLDKFQESFLKSNYLIEENGLGKYTASEYMKQLGYDINDSSILDNNREALKQNLDKIQAITGKKNSSKGSDKSPAFNPHSTVALIRILSFGSLFIVSNSQVFIPKIPTASPVRSPNPTNPPSQQSSTPTGRPSAFSSSVPSLTPTFKPTAEPTDFPSAEPTDLPTAEPTDLPTAEPTDLPTAEPSNQPSIQPTGQPTSQPSVQPTSKPTNQSVASPTSQPTSNPTISSSNNPTSQPTAEPSNQPSIQPTGQPTTNSSENPTSQPTSNPTISSSNNPTGQPTSQPSVQPTSKPTNQSVASPTSQPTVQPSIQPSVNSAIPQTNNIVASSLAKSSEPLITSTLPSAGFTAVVSTGAILATEIIAGVGLSGAALIASPILASLAMGSAIGGVAGGTINYFLDPSKDGEETGNQNDNSWTRRNLRGAEDKTKNSQDKHGDGREEAQIIAIVAGIVVGLAAALYAEKKLRERKVSQQDISIQVIARELINIIPERIEAIIAALNSPDIGNNNATALNIEIELDHLASSITTAANQNTSLSEYLRRLFADDKNLAQRMKDAISDEKIQKIFDNIQGDAPEINPNETNFEKLRRIIGIHPQRVFDNLVEALSDENTMDRSLHGSIDSDIESRSASQGSENYSDDFEKESSQSLESIITELEEESEKSVVSSNYSSIIGSEPSEIDDNDKKIERGNSESSDETPNLEKVADIDLITPLQTLIDQFTEFKSQIEGVDSSEALGSPSKSSEGIKADSDDDTEEKSADNQPDLNKKKQIAAEILSNLIEFLELQKIGIALTINNNEERKKEGQAIRNFDDNSFTDLRKAYLYQKAFASFAQENEDVIGGAVTDATVESYFGLVKAATGVEIKANDIIFNIEPLKGILAKRVENINLQSNSTFSQKIVSKANNNQLYLSEITKELTALNAVNSGKPFETNEENRSYNPINSQINEENSPHLSKLIQRDDISRYLIIAYDNQIMANNRGVSEDVSNLYPDNEERDGKNPGRVNLLEIKEASSLVRSVSSSNLLSRDRSNSH